MHLSLAVKNLFVTSISMLLIIITNGIDSLTNHNSFLIIIAIAFRVSLIMRGKKKKKILDHRSMKVWLSKGKYKKHLFSRHRDPFSYLCRGQLLSRGHK